MKNRLHLLGFALIVSIIIAELFFLFRIISKQNASYKGKNITLKKIEFSLDYSSLNQCEVQNNPFKLPGDYKVIRTEKIPEFSYEITAISNNGNNFIAIAKKKENGVSLFIKTGDFLGKWKIESISKNEVILVYKDIKKRISVW